VAPVIGDGNREGGDGVQPFSEGERGGGEVAPWCQRRMTQRRATRWLGRRKAAAGG
jgi:hypothetical protein